MRSWLPHAEPLATERPLVHVLRSSDGRGVRLDGEERPSVREQRTAALDNALAKLGAPGLSSS
jgi:hypothetical protein